MVRAVPRSVPRLIPRTPSHSYDYCLPSASSPRQCLGGCSATPVRKRWCLAVTDRPGHRTPNFPDRLCWDFIYLLIESLELDGLLSSNFFPGRICALSILQCGVISITVDLILWPPWIFKSNPKALYAVVQKPVPTRATSMVRCPLVFVQALPLDPVRYTHSSSPFQLKGSGEYPPGCGRFSALLDLDGQISPKMEDCWIMSFQNCSHDIRCGSARLSCGA
jgi:hypothetical protein